MSRERTISFDYGPDAPGLIAHSWWAEVDFLDERVGLCDVGLRKYVGIPEGCETFDAIFSTIPPDGLDYFEIHYNDESDKYHLDTAQDLEFYSGVGQFLQSMYADGFSYLRVEFQK